MGNFLHRVFMNSINHKRGTTLKCVYDPEIEAEGRCSLCNVPLCKTCNTEAELNNDLCHACTRQGKIARLYQIIRLSSCGLGLAWVVVAMIIFNNVQFINRILYGAYGLIGAIFINFLMAFILTRMMISDLKPHQRVFVGLSRYAATGNKMFFDQAIRSMKKVEDMSPYRDALFDQIVSILILQPYDLPMDWVNYLCEIFQLTEEELLSGIIEFGTDVFEENIFNQYYYQAMEPYIEVLKLTERDDLYNKLMDEIMKILDTVNLSELTKPPVYTISGQAAPQQQRKDPKEIRDSAFLTELKLIDSELEEFLVRVKRQKDYKKIKEIIDDFQLPAVPKNTFEAVKQIAAGGQAAKTQQAAPKQQIQGDLIALPEQVVDDADEIKKRCAECGQFFTKEELQTYEYNKVKLKVCANCLKILEKEGHREPKLYSDLF